MSASMLRQVFDATYLLMLGAWGGAAVLVLVLLPRSPARSSERLADAPWTRFLLGRFYRLGATCGAIALPAALCARLAFPEYRTPWFAPQSLILIGLILSMIAAASRLGHTTSPEPASRLSAIRARVVLLIGLLAALATIQALRPPPRSLGIIEPRPGAQPAPNQPSLPTSASETPEGGLH